MTVLIEQEPGSAGKSLVEHYQRNVLPDFHVEGVPATTKKMARPSSCADSPAQKVNEPCQSLANEADKQKQKSEQNDNFDRGDLGLSL